MPRYPAQVIKNMPEMAMFVYDMYLHMMRTSQQYQYRQVSYSLHFLITPIPVHQETIAKNM